MNDQQNNNPPKSRQRTATKPDVAKTGQDVVVRKGSPRVQQGVAQSKGLNPRLGAASTSVIRTQPKIYSPIYNMSNLNFPRDLRTVNAWCRNYYATNPYIRSGVNLHAAYTTSKFKLVCEDKKILAFFEDMLNKINFQNTLLEIGLEYWKLGEAIPYLELDSEQGIWQYILLHNPDFVHIQINTLQKDPIITLVPDEALKRIISGTNPQDRALRDQIPPEVLMYIQKGQDIPLDNFNVSHLKMLSSPYDTRGTSLITSCFRDLMLFDTIREAKIIQANNFINPLTLIKLGSENWKPTDDDIRQWQEQAVDSTGDQGYTIVTHSLVEIQKITNSGQTLDMNPDIEQCIKNIMVGMMVPSTIFDQDYGSYANGSMALQVLKSRYKNFQIQLKKWIEQKVLEPIAKIQDFYVTENGVSKLIVPTVEFEKIDLKETDTYINAVSNLIGDPAQPGSGKISLHTFYELMDTNYEVENSRLRLEARDQIIRQKEIQAMQRMEIEQLKTIGENTPIQDNKEIDTMEKSLDIEDQANDQAGGGDMGGGDMGMGGAPGGDMGGGDMGMGGAPGGDMGDMGGDMGGGEGGAPAGGAPELGTAPMAPPPEAP